MAAPTNLSSVPNDLSMEYFSDADLTKRAQERGYNFFTNGYVHGVRLFTTSDELCVDVAAKCYRSMKKNEHPHAVSLTINRKDKIFTERHCSCQAG